MDQTAFDIDGGLVLALVRSLSVAALLSVFGGLMFQVVVAPRALARIETHAATIQTRLDRLLMIGVGINLIATLLWLALQAADLADATSVTTTLAAVPLVVTQTRFGHLVILQLPVMLAVGGVLPGRRHWLALWLSALAIILQGAHGHAAAMEGYRLLVMTDMLHLLSVGAWLGGLLPLLLVVQGAPARAGATAARWFSPLGQVGVAGVILSASLQGWVFVGGVAGLFDTAYGWVVLVKIALLIVLLGFAVANRFRFAPALLCEHSTTAKHVLVWSIAVQTLFGVAAVVAAAILSSLAPPMKM
jgi:putative copper resistance protein D